jgi:hypothetical protein
MPILVTRVPCAEHRTTSSTRATLFLQHSPFIIWVKVVVTHPKDERGNVEGKPVPTPSERVDLKSTLSIHVGTGESNGRGTCDRWWEKEPRFNRRFKVIRQGSPSFSDRSSGVRGSPPSQREPDGSRWNGAVPVRLQTRTLGPAPAAERLPLSAGRLPSLASVESGPRAIRDEILSAC